MGNHAFNLSTCARPNILTLQPYRCARDDYEDNGTNILLDANENAFGPSLDFKLDEPPNAATANGVTNKVVSEVDILGLHRYPDPLRNTHHHTSKTLQPENLFVGVGSDEVIDALLRCFCTPSRDKILTCPPTYGMYSVSAQVNDIEVIKVPLDAANAFRLRPEAINTAISSDSCIKLVYICSPGNPTASLISKSDIEQVLDNTWNGIVVLDEAYIDFSPDGSSLAEWVMEWPNLVVMQTLSKAFGLAGIRLGVAFTSLQIASLLNNLKAPYNISSPTSTLANMALQPKNIALMKRNRENILSQRERLSQELPLIPRAGRFLGGMDSNFLLVEILDRPRSEGGKPSNEAALALYEELAECEGIVVRFRGKELGCLGCLRITVGTESEVNKLLRQMRSLLDAKSHVKQHLEHEREQEVNDIVA
ncbi:MAG: hypothetical protein Q9190_003722 [Brigantiaea leucoxantha]